ncbi:HAD-like protein [Sodiomyces alkalinus F11]|uniref:HAD-like protein n=1 Tax=Sodiomyces alkalinus (strain CBS 110278 / VKM F-3762 / F11) TaxID=1314773 RepID=A0A3N2PIT5_SODAK|nr:HAD-like protein [Sodiomyces alkalinus F11]ROT34459.1 HAD-like protein [Sodiomyces alkalinus F11]
MRTLVFSMAVSKPLRFAPLKQGVSPSPDAPRLQGVVFDVDGTLCEPQTYMFSQMRAALSIAKSIDILEHVYSLPTPEAREEAMETIRAIEREAMAAQVAQPGLAEIMSYLDARGIRKGICTRNFDTPVAHLLGKFLPDSHFSPIVTRDFRPAKPHPAGILHIASSWGLNGTEVGEEGEADASGLIMVGDSIDDMTAGRKAGAATVLLLNDVNGHLVEHHHTDLVIRRLDELIPILEEGFEIRRSTNP